MILQILISVIRFFASWTLKPGRRSMFVNPVIFILFNGFEGRFTIQFIAEILFWIGLMGSFMREQVLVKLRLLTTQITDIRIDV